MSLYPFCIEFERPRQCPRRDVGLTPQELLTLLALPQSNREGCRPWSNLQAARDAGSTIKEEKDKFQVNVDVQHFAPEEISVKTADGHLVVEAKHEERRDEHGFVSRGFTRRYALPEGVEADSVMSTLSSDGVLKITAPLKAPPKNANERVVPIIQTGPVKKQAGSEELIQG